MSTTTNSQPPSYHPRKPLPPTELLTHPSQLPPFTALIALAFHTPPANPLTTAFTTEIDGTPPPYPHPTITATRFTTHFHAGISAAFAAGAQLICSPSVSSPSALAVWEPPDFTGTPFNQVRKDPGPVLAEWQGHVRRMKESHVRGRPCWHLGFLARNPDPETPRVEGAVRAVVEPYLERVRVESRQSAEGVVAWLEATGERAVGIYEGFGFRVCEVVRIGVGKVNEEGWPEEGGKGARAWGLIFEP